MSNPVAYDDNDDNWNGAAARTPFRFDNNGRQRAPRSFFTASTGNNNSNSNNNSKRWQSRARAAPASLPSDPLGYSNSREFAAIDDITLLLFYTETNDDVIFDPANDQSLMELFAAPFEFSNSESLSLYESLVTRARYYCKPHPQASSVARDVSAELRVPATELLVLVYKRDSAAESIVKDRRTAPFDNSENGLGSFDGRSAQLVFFNQYAHTPAVLGTIVWHNAVRINASVGIIAVRIQETL